jgi:hypothetical protein
LYSCTLVASIIKEHSSHYLTNPSITASIIATLLSDVILLDTNNLSKDSKKAKSKDIEMLK